MNAELRLNLIERYKHKGALRQIGVRQGQCFIRTGLPLDMQDIEIDRARAPVLMTDAPELLLNPLEIGKKLIRRTVKRNARRRIEKGRLIGLAPRRRFVERRDSLHIYRRKLRHAP